MPTIHATPTMPPEIAPERMGVRARWLRERSVRGTVDCYYRRRWRRQQSRGLDEQRGAYPWNAASRDSEGVIALAARVGVVGMASRWGSSRWEAVEFPASEDWINLKVEE